MKAIDIDAAHQRDARGAAVHEAGHVVAALAMGADVFEAYVLPNIDVADPREFKTVLGRVTLGQEIRSPFTNAVISLAGEVADVLTDDDWAFLWIDPDPAGWADDVAYLIADEAETMSDSDLRGAGFASAGEVYEKGLDSEPLGAAIASITSNPLLFWWIVDELEGRCREARLTGRNSALSGRSIVEASERLGLVPLAVGAA